MSFTGGYYGVIVVLAAPVVGDLLKPVIGLSALYISLVIIVCGTVYTVESFVRVEYEDDKI